MCLVICEYSFENNHRSVESTLVSLGMTEYNFNIMTEQTISFKPAFLWDGSKQLAGKLELTNDALHFYIDDFKDSKLDLKIRMKGISKTKLYSLYGLGPAGLEISDDPPYLHLYPA